jgi:hypothetical protein
MITELKPCPFCDNLPLRLECEEMSGKDGNFEYVCFYFDCPIYMLGFSLSKWNTRPCEDELQAEIARLKGCL